MYITIIILYKFLIFFTHVIKKKYLLILLFIKHFYLFLYNLTYNNFNFFKFYNAKM